MESGLLRKLNEFLVDNDDLAALNARLAQLNLFRVLRIERAEIRHSNVLGWLLDPRGAHGLGDVFLRRFLSRLLLWNDGVRVPFTAADVELMDLDEITVRREWRNIDVLVECGAPKWCLLIENKIRSGESSGQLAKYHATVQAEMSGVPIVPVLLTLSGEEPSSEGKGAGYIAVSYLDILELVERLVQQRRSRIPADALVLLQHWQEALRRLTMSDSEMVELCRRIYRRHRDAIKMIVEYGVVSGVMDACAEFVRESTEAAFEPVVRSDMTMFMPREMEACQSAVTPGWERLPRSYPITWWFHTPKPGRLKLGLEVGPIADAGFRVELLKACVRAGFVLKRKDALTRPGRWTRIWTKTLPLRVDGEGEPTDDPIEVKQVAKKLWEAAAQETPRLVRALSGVSWPPRK